MKKSEKISCIIPAYNESERILNVLSAALGNDELDEVIVVNDGSKDNTEEVLKKVRGIHLISYKKNRGKSFAVMTGLKKAKNDLVLMLDSDLIGLRSKDITALIQPVLSGKADMSLTLRKNSLKTYKWLGMDFISGERVFNKKVLGDLNELGKLRGFGLESYINNIVIEKKLRLKVVYWDQVITPRKFVKFGWWKGIIGDLKMVQEVIATTGPFRFFSQMVHMRSLRIP